MTSYQTKIVICGDPRVGKTSLRRSYLGKSFEVSYLETVGADFSIVELNNESIHTINQLWDIAGQPKYAGTHPSYFIRSHAAIIVYDVTIPETFSNIPLWLNRFDEYTNNGLIISIVGNKIDLDEKITEHDQTSLISQLQSKYPQYKFKSFRTSAKTGSNIRTCVETTVWDIVDWIDQLIPVETKELILWDHIPGAFISTYDVRSGPSILRKYPGTEISPNEYFNLIKFATILDLENFAGQDTIIGHLPWSEIRGDYHYLAFKLIIDVNLIEIFFVAFVCKKEITELLNAHNIELYQSFASVEEQLRRKINASDMDLELQASLGEFDSILKELMTSVFALVKQYIS
ncbi:MAG: GTP-binding protein [Candidatus Heimdallarchaeota archaeon]|nr:GTP-binding protein [Candidatus Heimdallarchaeota archaeon]